MYGDWGWHHAAKKMNEVFPVIDKNLQKDLEFFNFSIICISFSTQMLARLFKKKKNGYFPPYIPMRYPVKKYGLHLERLKHQMSVLTGVK